MEQLGGLRIRQLHMQLHIQAQTRLPPIFKSPSFTRFRAFPIIQFKNIYPQVELQCLSGSTRWELC